jgi:hypothetical protein
MAMYWVPEIIEAGDSKTYISKYGLGGITIVPGLLSLGVTSPAEVIFDNNNQSFPVVAYLENTSDIEARNVEIRLELPSGFRANESIRNLGDMESGGISQITWNVRPENIDDLPDEMTYRVVVDADNTDSNEVERMVKFVGPPVLDANITLMENVEVINGQLEPNPFRVQARLSNSGESSLYGVKAELILPPGLLPASSEKLSKHLGMLDSKENINVNWAIEALRVDGTMPFAVKVSGINDYEKTIVEEIELPRLEPLIYLRKTPGREDEDYLSVDIVAANIGEAETLKFDFNYNSEKLLLTHVSRGDLFVGDNNLLPFNRPTRSEDGTLSFAQELPFNRGNGTIATVHFKKKESDAGQIYLDDLSLLNSMGEEIEISLRNILKEETE